MGATCRRILVAESDHAVRTMLVAVLTGDGYAVRAVASVGQAVRVLAQESVDLILSSTLTRFPDDALQVPGAILAAAGATSVVLLSTHPLDPVAVQAAGYRDLLLKPFNLTDLDAIVARWLG